MNDFEPIGILIAVAGTIVVLAIVVLCALVWTHLRMRSGKS